MSKDKKTYFSPEQKVAAVWRHLLEQEPVSKICNELGVSPVSFYAWQKMLFTNGESAFSKDSKRQEKALENKITTMEKTLQHKDNVISEIMSEYVALKKKNGAR